MLGEKRRLREENTRLREENARLSAILQDRENREKEEERLKKQWDNLWAYTGRPQPGVQEE